MPMKTCEGCAFTDGAVANLEPDNNLRGQLCVLGAIPFYCHHAEDGSLQNLKDVKRSELRERIQSGQTVICQGWKREVSELAATGYYAKSLTAKRAIAVLGLGALAIFTSTQDRQKKEQAAKNLKGVILMLNRERGFTEVVDE
jgi:hypothetical protein